MELGGVTGPEILARGSTFFPFSPKPTFSLVKTIYGVPTTVVRTPPSTFFTRLVYRGIWCFWKRTHLLDLDPENAYF